MVDHTVGILKALADDTRIAIVRELIGGRELRTQELTKKFTLSQPTLSHHFALLVDAHILNATKEGSYWVYSLNDEYLTRIGIDIQKLAYAKHAHD